MVVQKVSVHLLYGKKKSNSLSDKNLFKTYDIIL